MMFDNSDYLLLKTQLDFIQDFIDNEAKAYHENPKEFLLFLRIYQSNTQLFGRSLKPAKQILCGAKKRESRESGKRLQRR